MPVENDIPDNTTKQKRSRVYECCNQVMVCDTPHSPLRRLYRCRHRSGALYGALCGAVHHRLHLVCGAQHRLSSGTHGSPGSPRGRSEPCHAHAEQGAGVQPGGAYHCARHRELPTVGPVSRREQRTGVLRCAFWGSSGTAAPAPLPAGRRQYRAGHCCIASAD